MLKNITSKKFKYVAGRILNSWNLPNVDGDYDVRKSAPGRVTGYQSQGTWEAGVSPLTMPPKLTEYVNRIHVSLHCERCCAAAVRCSRQDRAAWKGFQQETVSSSSRAARDEKQKLAPELDRVGRGSHQLCPSTARSDARMLLLLLCLPTAFGPARLVATL
ncbi:hypothetical protein LY76DRAFT_288765 [Colletotrichum caudatum]|nr:hypothetical protein LY76DRAFT_288765 [Colletotrichum caudatum]